MASPTPVFPEVGSTMVPPGFSSPAFSPASIIAMPIRSLPLEPRLRFLGRDLAADHRQLLLEVLGLAFPVVGGAEVGPRRGEGRVVPAAGEPGGVMDDP